MAKLTREMVLKFRGLLKREHLVIPEWDNLEVWVREMTMDEKDDYEASMIEARQTTDGQATAKMNFKQANAKLAVVVLVDEEGHQLFNPKTDVSLIGSMGSKGLDRVIRLARKLSGMTKESKEDLRKNLPATQTDDSGSSSPES